LHFTSIGIFSRWVGFRPDESPRGSGFCRSIFSCVVSMNSIIQVGSRTDVMSSCLVASEDIHEMHTHSTTHRLWRGPANGGICHLSKVSGKYHG